jgi:Berberine and berberine like
MRRCCRRRAGRPPRRQGRRRGGVYANFLSDEGASGVEDADGERLKRLTALKDRWDPANLFRMNANIPPSPPGRR